MAGEFLAGLGAFKNMMDIVKAIKDMDNAAVRNAAVIELQGKIFTAQTEQTALISRINELEKEVQKFEKWENEKKRYELKQLQDGAFAYALKSSMSGGEPKHYICATCYEDNKKIIMHGATDYLGEKSLTCPKCKTKFLHYWGMSSHAERKVTVDDTVAVDYDPFR